MILLFIGKQNVKLRRTAAKYTARSIERNPKETSHFVGPTSGEELCKTKCGSELVFEIQIMTFRSSLFNSIKKLGALFSRALSSALALCARLSSVLPAAAVSITVKTFGSTSRSSPRASDDPSEG